MKISLQQIALVSLQGLNQASAHYGFPWVIFNNQVSKRWQYVRPTPSFWPFYDYSGPDAMCNRNATLPLFPIETLKMPAGSSISFGISSIWSPESEHEYFNDWEKYGSHVHHPGPATAWMSKAPGELNDYAGDGDWFKIAAIGASDGIYWDYNGASKQANRFLNFTVPESTPPGKYLLRAEHLFMGHSIEQEYNRTQMFVSCAHVDIMGDGKGTPGPTTKFPGAFKATDPGK